MERPSMMDIIAHLKVLLDAHPEEYAPPFRNLNKAALYDIVASGYADLFILHDVP